MSKNNPENLKSDLELNEYGKAVLDAEKVLLALEKNADFKKLIDFLVKDKVLQYNKWLAAENRDEERRKYAKRKLEAAANLEVELADIKRLAEQIRNDMKATKENELAEARMKAEEKSEIVDDNGGF